MTAFVAGATGYTGRAVVAASVAAGVPTVAHVRPDSSRLDDWRRRFDGVGARVNTTAWEPADLETTLGELSPTVVYALLGTTRRRAKGEGMGAAEAYERVDYGLTMMLLRAVGRAAPRARFVYLSTTGVSDSGNSYMSARWRCEQAVLASGVPYTIARPSVITGTDRDDGRLGERVAGTALAGALAVAGALGARRFRDRYAPTTNTVLGAALVRLASDPGAANTIVESEGLRV